MGELRLKAIIGATAAAFALSLATTADAATLLFKFTEVDAAGLGAGPFGTVTATDTGTGVDFSVTLNSGYEFRLAPDDNHHALNFILPTAGLTATGLAATFVQDTSSTTFAASPFAPPGGSDFFNYDIECKEGVHTGPPAGRTLCQPGWDPTLNPTSMSFSIAGITTADLGSLLYNGKDIYFSADIVNADGATGNVGAVLVPEPATWAMMLVGVFGLGAMMRSVRGRRLLATSIA